MSTPPPPPSEPTPPPTDPQPPAPASGKVVMGYFTNWAIYARGYPPASVPANTLSHILYAFARPLENGDVLLTDTWSDTDKHYDGDKWGEPGTNLYGNFKQFNLRKRKERKLKLLLSVGGWTLSTNFPAVASNPTNRAKFIQACLDHIENLGLDGIDIDWEYPKSMQEGEDFYLLLKELRVALTHLQRKKGDKSPYLLTIACPCGSSNYSLMPIGKYAQVLDFFNLMAYDFAGAWDSTTGHQAKLYGSEPSCERAVTDYIAKGAKPGQLILGIPLYGRSFLNTQPTVPSPFSGVGRGSWEPGVYDYKALPLAASTVSVDLKLGASWCYEPTAKEFVSYDSPEVVDLKCQWATKMGLGGVMVWELSGDYKIDQPASIMKIFQNWANKNGGLEKTANHLRYPKSKYDNLRTGFGLPDDDDSQV